VSFLDASGGAELLCPLVFSLCFVRSTTQQRNQGISEGAARRQVVVASKLLEIPQPFRKL